MNKILSWFSKALSENDVPSSKRVVGVAGMICLHVVWAICALKYGFEGRVAGGFDVLAITDGTLLGVTTLVSAFKINKEADDK